MSSSAHPAILPGAEPWSHHAPAGGVTAGVLVLHGFTGNPSSMRRFAEAMAAAGCHVELPRLPGHGTTVDDMIATRWADWTGELSMPLLLFTSREDHVVAPTDSEYLAGHYGGPVDHRWLERIYHVATQDFDRDVIDLAAAEFVAKVTGS